MKTQPPSPATSAPLAVFEAAIRELGERDARLARLAALLARKVAQ